MFSNKDLKAIAVLFMSKLSKTAPRSKMMFLIACIKNSDMSSFGFGEQKQFNFF
jgi:hypothetical protein